MFKNILLALFCLLTLASQGQAANILYIGDSHTVGYFGTHFDQHLRDAGHSVATYGSCGSVPYWWEKGQQTNCGFYSKDLEGTEVKMDKAPTPLMADLLKIQNPDIVIMEFGGNYRNFPDDEFVVNDIKKIVNQVKLTGAKCFWITNPDSRNNTQAIARVLGLIRKGVGDSCPIFVSSAVTKYPETGGDGIHYWGKEGLAIVKVWAKMAFESFGLFESSN